MIIIHKMNDNMHKCKKIAFDKIKKNFIKQIKTKYISLVNKYIMEIYRDL